MRTRVLTVLAFVIAACVPVGLYARLAVLEARSGSRAEIEETLDGMGRLVDSWVQTDEDRLRSAMGVLCADAGATPLEAEMLPEDRERAIGRRIVGTAGALGVSAIDVVARTSSGTRLVASDHLESLSSSPYREPLETVLAERERLFVRHLSDDDLEAGRPMLVLGCDRSDGTVDRIVLGAMAIDEAYESDVPAGSARVRSGLYAVTEAPEAPHRRTAHELRDGYAVFVWAEEGGEDRVAARVARLGFLALGVAFFVAVILGVLVAGRFAHALGLLGEAAERVGRGDLEVTLSSRRGDAGATISAFNRMTRELKDARGRAIRAERIAAWRDIARRIAHEIKNPLTPIRMSIETMRRTHAREHPDFDEIFDEGTRTVLEEVERLERIVTEFSRFARLPRPRPRPLDVREVVSHVVGLHDVGGADATVSDAGLAAASGPRVRMRVEEGVREVRADREQLVQVLVNLVKNAADAAASKQGEGAGQVLVIVRALGDGARIEVHDDGPGVPPEERERIREPYYTTKSGGTGLGLAIVDRIVSDHGGSLSIEDSSELGGACFVITLNAEGPPEEADVSATV